MALGNGLCTQVDTDPHADRLSVSICAAGGNWRRDRRRSGRLCGFESGTFHFRFFFDS